MGGAWGGMGGKGVWGSRGWRYGEHEGRGHGGRGGGVGEGGGGGERALPHFDEFCLLELYLVLIVKIIEKSLSASAREGRRSIVKYP